MQEKPAPAKKSFSPDWLVRGVLTKLGDTFDRLTGRGWKPSSSLATSELIEKLKQLLDAEALDKGPDGVFVPHNIKLKMQWDKFSADSDKSIKALENELLTAAIDHINDKLYYTYAPLRIEVKQDYFTQGVKLFVSFERFGREEEHEAELSVHVSGTPDGPDPDRPTLPEPDVTFIARFVERGAPVQRSLRFRPGTRISVGRKKENELTIDDESVSKVHAAIVLNSEGGLTVADTGSTNGTFVGDERISYGKAVVVGPSEKVMFGTVGVTFERVQAPLVAEPVEEPESDSVSIDGFEFKRRASEQTEVLPAEQPIAAPTEQWNSQVPPTEASIELEPQEKSGNE